MIFVKFTLALALAVTLANPAVAQTLPSYDTKAHCEQLLALDKTQSEEQLSQCIAAYQRAHDALEPQWAAVPPSIRKECDRLATALGTGSYLVLAGCIEQELNNAKKKQGTGSD